MEAALLKAIRDNAARRKAANQEPTYTTRIEIQQQVNEALNRLYANGQIEVGRTANDKWIKVRE